MMKWILLLGVAWASCVVPSGDSNSLQFIDVVSNEGSELPSVLRLVSGRPTLLRLRPPPQSPPIEDINITLTVPQGIAVSVPPSNTSTTTLVLKALVTSGVVFAVTATGELPPSSSICFSRAVTRDRDFQGVLPGPPGGTPGRLDVSSTVLGVLRIGARGPTGLVPTRSFSVFTTELPAPEWQGPWPFRVELRVDIIRNSRTSTAGGRLPIIVPQGWFLENLPDKFLVIPQLQDSPPGLLVPAYLSFIPVQVTSATPREIRFGAVISDDPQWAGVVPDVTAITVIAYQRARIEVSPSYFLGMLPSALSVVSLKPSVAPLFPVEMELVIPVGFISNVTNITFPANSSTAVLVPLTSSSTLSRAPVLLQFLPARSNDIQFTYLTPNNGGLLLYTTNKGQIIVGGISNSSVELYVGGTFNFTLEFIRTGPYSMEGGEVNFTVPPGFITFPSSLRFPKFPDSEAIYRQQYTVTVLAVGTSPLSTPSPFVIRDVVSRDFQWSNVTVSPNSFLISSWSRGVVSVFPSAISCLQLQSTNFTISLQPAPLSEVFFDIRFTTNAFRVREGNRVRVAAGQTNKLIIVDSIAEVPVTIRDNITVYPSISADRQFNNISANVSVVSVYSTVRGSVSIQKGGSSESIPLTFLRLQANTAVTLVISLLKPGRYSVDGALIPITYSAADISLQGKWLTTAGLQFPVDAMDPADYGRAVSLELRAGDHQSTSTVRFGALISNDLQWAGVIPSVTALTIVTVLDPLIVLSRTEIRLLVRQNASFNITLAFPPTADVVFPLAVPEGFNVPASVTVRAGESGAIVNVLATDQPAPPSDLRVFPGSSSDLSYDRLPPAANTVRISSVVRGEVQFVGMYPRQIFISQQLPLAIRLINRTPFFVANGGGFIPFSVPSGFNFSVVGATIVNGGLQFSALTTAVQDINITLINQGTRAAGSVEIGAIQSQDPQWNDIPGVSFALSSTTPGNITILPASCSVGYFVGEVGTVEFLLSDVDEQQVTLQITGDSPFGSPSPSLQTQPPSPANVQLVSVLTIPPRVRAVNVTFLAVNDSTFPAVYSVSAAQSSDLQFSGVQPSCRELEVYSTYKGEFRILNAPTEITFAPFASSSIVLELIKRGKYSPQAATSFIPVRVPSGYSVRVGGRSLTRDAVDPTLFKVPILSDLQQEMTLQADGLTRSTQNLEFLPIEGDDIQWRGLLPVPASIRLSSGTSSSVTTSPPSSTSLPTTAPSSLAPSVPAPFNFSVFNTSFPTAFTPSSLAPTSLSPSSLAPTSLSSSSLAPTLALINITNITINNNTFINNTNNSDTTAIIPVFPFFPNVSTSSPSTPFFNASLSPTLAPTQNMTNNTNNPFIIPILDESNSTNSSSVSSLSPTASFNETFRDPFILVNISSTLSPSTLSPSTLSPSTLSPSTLSPSTLSPTLQPTLFPTSIPSSFPTSPPTQQPTLAPSLNSSSPPSLFVIPVVLPPSSSSAPTSFPSSLSPTANNITFAPTAGNSLGAARSTTALDPKYIYIIIGVLAGLLLLLCCCCFFCRRARKKDQASAAGAPTPEQQGLVSGDHGRGAAGTAAAAAAAAAATAAAERKSSVEMAESKSLLSGAPIVLAPSRDQEGVRLAQNQQGDLREAPLFLPAAKDNNTFGFADNTFPSNAPEPVVYPPITSVSDLASSSPPSPFDDSSSSSVFPSSAPVFADTATGLGFQQSEPQQEGGYYDNQDQEGYAYAEEGGDYYEEPYYYGEDGQADGQYYEGEYQDPHYPQR